MKATGKYRMLGLMSGTSLDGLDIACVEFKLGRRWSYNVMHAVTLEYPEKWKRRLEDVHLLQGEALVRLHSAYGRYLGESCAWFIKKKKLRGMDGISSHGHTVFHQPQNGFTFQLGDGASIHALTGLPVVADFRSLDIQLGGEGAPLVPMGDRLLFASADICLNLGGIANLSMEVKGKRRAFDVCFCNMALNHLARQAGKPYDGQGRLASHGAVDVRLLKRLSKAYEKVRRKRKSLGREFFESNIRPLLDQRSIPLADRLRTVVESVADEIEGAMPPDHKHLQMLTTGGGAWNHYLIEVLRNRLAGRVSVVLPSRKVIDFKEAIIFAFLGVLRLRGEVNVLRSVTRSRRDSSSGVVIGRPENA
jgi:anhydro-N-acetylmuramic acid kinase